jgi:hypothetical protein
LALRGVGPESEAESVRFHGRRVTKVGPEVKHGLFRVAGRARNPKKLPSEGWGPLNKGCERRTWAPSHSLTGCKPSPSAFCPLAATYFQGTTQCFSLIGREPCNRDAAKIAAWLRAFNCKEDNASGGRFDFLKCGPKLLRGGQGRRDHATAQISAIVSGVRGVSPFPYVRSPLPFHFKTACFVTHKELPLTLLRPLVNFDAYNGLIAVFLPSSRDLLQLRQAIIERLEKGRA